MAVCEICGTKLGIGNQTYFGVPGVDTFLNICKTCDANISIIRSSNPTPENLKKAKNYLKPLLKERHMKRVVSDYIIQLLSEADEKKIRQERKIEEEKKVIEAQRTTAKEAESRKEEAKLHKAENIKNFKTTTSNTFEGYKITDYIGVVSGEVVLGTGFFTEVSARVSDVLGVSSEAYEGKFGEAKRYALNKAVENALNIGANGLLAVDFDILTIASNMIVTSANGTAVRIERVR